MSNEFKFISPSEIVIPSAKKLRELLHMKTLSEDDRDIALHVIRSIELYQGIPFEWSVQETMFLRDNPESRWIDYIIYRYKLRLYPRLKKVTDFPVYALIEPTSICNFRCGFCFQADPTFNKKSQGFMKHMDIELFKRIVDELELGRCRAITLASRGEPTLCPTLPEMLRYLKGKFLEVKLNTNGSMLNPELNAAILDSVNELVFSVDAGDKETYEKLRLNGKFEKTFENVKSFNEQRKNHPGAVTHTRISGVDVGQDRDELLATWGPLVDNVGITPCEERWNVYENEIKPDITSPCDYLWERTYIWADGKMNPCDVDYKSNLSPGSLTLGSTSTIGDIWHGEAYTNIRKKHLEGKRSEFNPCDRCGVV